MLNPHELPGRNRDWAARPYQGNGRSGQGYGRTGRVEMDLWPERSRDGNPARDNALGLTLWVFAAGISLALITVGLLGLGMF